MRELKLILPLHLQAGKSAKAKSYALSLNWWRNAHPQIITKVKEKYKKIIKDQVKEDWNLAFVNPYIEYHFYAGSNRRVDLRNWTGMADKFACDALVEYFVFRDDNTNFITETRDIYKGVDKGNGRIEMIIRSSN